MSDQPLVLLSRVAHSLGELRARVVFIGGVIAPLLHSHPPFSGARPTTDVDAIALTVSYSDFESLQGALRERGFRQIPGASHAYQWLTPGDPPTRFDLVPAGTHFGASGNPVDEMALATAVEMEIGPGVVIRHASAPGFLALKFAAFRDRGEHDPFASHDLEDILALLASRPGIVDETAAAPAELRSFVGNRAALLMEHEGLEDLLAGHLSNAVKVPAGASIGWARDRLVGLAALSV